MHAVRCRIMDNIDRIMKEADRLGFGCSYGKYRAAYPGESPAAKPAASPPDQQALPKSKHVCKFCKKPFIPTHGGQQYCGPECRYKNKRKKQNEYHRKKVSGELANKPLLTKICVQCGADFKTMDYRKITCSPECAADRRRDVTRKWHAAQKTKEG